MKNLKGLRAKRGISQQKLAEHLGTYQQNIHLYETGSVEPGIDTLKLMAAYFDTSIDYLVGATLESRKIEPVQKYDLNNDESALVDKFRQLSALQKQSVCLHLEAFLDEK